MKLLLRSSISSATSSSYAAGWRTFLNYCLLTQSDPWRPNDAIIIGFIAHLTFPKHKKPTGLSVSTLKSYLSAINHFQLLWGFPNIITDRPLVERCIRGFKRLRGTVTNQKLPITLDMLTYISKLILPNTKIHAICWCVCVLGLIGLLRLGELLPDSKHTDLILYSSNITWINDSHFTLRLNASKTDPFRHGVPIHFFANHKSVACPVRAIRYLLSLHITDQPLFAMGGPPSTYGKLYTRDQFINWLRISLTIINHEHKLGIDPSKYSGHSLRRGGATSLHLRGISEQTIKMLGRWRSDAFRRYIDSPIEQLRLAQTQLIQSSSIEIMDFNRTTPSSVWMDD